MRAYSENDPTTDMVLIGPGLLGLDGYVPPARYTSPHPTVPVWPPDWGRTVLKPCRRRR
jgi:hypothetical protein